MSALDTVNQKIATIQETPGRFAARVNGEAVSLVFSEADPTGDDDYVFHMENSGLFVLEISSYTVILAVAGKVRLDKVTKTTLVGGTAIVPRNKRTFLDNFDIGVRANRGVNITGITSVGDGLDIAGMAAADEVTHKFSGSILLDPGEGVALLAYEGASIASGVFHVHVQPESHLKK